MVLLTKALRFYRTEVRRLAFWAPKAGEDWRRSLALTYAATVWGMIGFVAYMQWRYEDTSKSSKTDEIVNDHEEEPSQGRKQKTEFSAVIEYKEGHAPYSTRIYQYFTSLTKASDGGSTEK